MTVPWWVGAALFLAACGDTLPADVQGYKERCVRLNENPIPRYDGDPHAGMKNVYVCNLESAAVTADARPFPEGALVVKESRREGEDFDWLVATARKQAGRWSWDEYTRNFADEDLRRLLVSESKCTGCHNKAASIDYIFTRYNR